MLNNRREWSRSSGMENSVQVLVAAVGVSISRGKQPGDMVSLEAKANSKHSNDDSTTRVFLSSNIFNQCAERQSTVIGR